MQRNIRASVSYFLMTLLVSPLEFGYTKCTTRARCLSPRTALLRICLPAPAQVALLFFIASHVCGCCVARVADSLVWSLELREYATQQQNFLRCKRVAYVVFRRILRCKA